MKATRSLAGVLLFLASLLASRASAQPKTPSALEVRDFSNRTHDPERGWIGSVTAYMVRENLADLYPIAYASGSRRSPLSVSGRVEPAIGSPGPSRVRLVADIDGVADGPKALAVEGHVDDLVELASDLSGQIARSLGVVLGSRQSRFGRAMSSDSDALQLFGNALREQRTYKRAEALAGALESDPGFAAAELETARLQVDRRDYAAAASHLRRAVEIQPDYDRGHLELALVLLQLRDLDAAEVHLRQAVAIAPDSADNHVELGNLLRTRGRLREAGQSYKNAVDAQPGHLEALAGLSLVQWRMGGREPEASAIPEPALVAAARERAASHTRNPREKTTEPEARKPARRSPRPDASPPAAASATVSPQPMRTRPSKTSTEQAKVERAAMKADDQTQLDAAQESLMRRRGSTVEAQGILIEARKAFSRGDRAGAYGKLADLYDQLKMRYAARGVRRIAAGLASGDGTESALASGRPAPRKAAPRPTPVAVSTPRPRIDPAPSTRRTRSLQRPTPQSPAPVSTTDDADIAWAREMMAAGRGDKAKQQKILASAEAALAAGDRAQMYNILGEFYDSAGLRFSAESARDAAEAEAKRAANLARPERQPTPPPSQRREASRRTRSRPTPTPTLKAQPPPTPQPATRVTTAAPKPVPPAAATAKPPARQRQDAERVTAANDLTWARQMLAGSRADREVQEQFLEAAEEALEGSDLRAMYQSLAEFYEAAGLRYSAQSAQRAAAAIGTAPGPSVIAGGDTSRPSSKTEIETTPARSVIAGGDTSRPSSTPKRERGQAKAEAQRYQSEELAAARDVWLHARRDRPALLELLESAASAAAAGDEPTMHDELAELYDTARMRYSAKRERELAASARANLSRATPERVARLEPTKVADDQQPTRRAKVERSTTATSKRPTPSDERNPPVLSVRPPVGVAASSIRANRDDRKQLADARRLLSRSRAPATGRPLLNAAEEALGLGDRQAAYLALARFYRSQGLTYAAIAADRAAADVGGRPTSEPAVSVARKTPPTQQPATAEPTPSRVAETRTPPASARKAATHAPHESVLRAGVDSAEAVALKKALATLSGWHAAWEAKDHSRYLSHYDASFSSGARDIDDWRSHKARVFSAAKTIDVDLNGVSASVEDGRVTLILDQSYRSDRYEDRGRKTIVLEQRDGVYKIVRETATRGSPPSPGGPHDDVAPVAKQFEESMSAVMDAVQSWHKAWESTNLNSYLDHYASDFSSGKRDLDAWRQHKRAVFASTGTVHVAMSDVAVELDGDSAVVKFEQLYESDTHSDRGRKTLRLTKGDDGNFKIAGEEWNAIR